MHDLELTYKDGASFRGFNLNLIALIGCVGIAFAVCFAQILANRVVLMGALLAFMAFFTWLCVENLALPALLFFLPWSPLIRLSVDSISLYTIALLVACLLSFAKSGFRVDGQHVFAGCLFALTLAAKLIQGNMFSNSYYCFVVMLFLWPYAQKEPPRIGFRGLTLFFACGIISASLSAQQFALLPSISPYITVHSYQTITRHMGYYGDPNFYSAHVSACLGGVLVALSEEKKRPWQLTLMGAALVLVYCGLLSASKSFVIVALSMLVVWIPVLIAKSALNGRYGLFALILITALALTQLPAFQSLLSVLNTRFSYASNASQLTTGRTDIWAKYLAEFARNIPLTLFGEGFTDVIFAGKASHNTIIQGIYQFGLVGFPFLVAWSCRAVKNLAPKPKESGRRYLFGAWWPYVLILCIGAFLPWMALDILFFDELFLLPAYVMLGISYCS